MHCFGRKFSSDSNDVMRLRSRPAPGQGGHKNRETENRTEAETELTEISVFSINRYFSVSIYTNRIKFGRIRFLAPPTEQDRIDRIE
jgi:hypothetical protein